MASRGDGSLKPSDALRSDRSADAPRSDRSALDSSRSQVGSRSVSPHVGYKAMAQHSSGKFPIDPRQLVNGTLAWTDREYTYAHPPGPLTGSLLFACPYKKVRSGAYRVAAYVPGRVFIWCNPNSDRNGGIPDLAWRPAGLTIALTHMEEFDKTPDHPFRVFRVYSHDLRAGETVDIPVTSSWIGGIAFAEATEKCARPACQFAPSRSLGHGYCCNHCMKHDDGKHGSRCRQRPAVVVNLGREKPAQEEDADDALMTSSANPAASSSSTAPVPTTDPHDDEAGAAEPQTVEEEPVAEDTAAADRRPMSPAASPSDDTPIGEPTPAPTAAVNPTTIVAPSRQRETEVEPAPEAEEESVPKVDSLALMVRFTSFIEDDEEDLALQARFGDVHDLGEPLRKGVCTMAAGEMHDEFLAEFSTPLQRAVMAKLRIWDAGEYEYSLNEVMNLSRWLEGKLLPPPVQPLRFSTSKKLICMCALLVVLGCVCLVTFLTVIIKSPAAVEASGLLQGPGGRFTFTGTAVRLHGLRDLPHLSEEELRCAQDVVLDTPEGDFHFYRVASVARPPGGDGLRISGADGTVIVLQGDMVTVRRPFESELFLNFEAGHAKAASGSFRALAALPNASRAATGSKVSGSQAAVGAASAAAAGVTQIRVPTLATAQSKT